MQGKHVKLQDDPNRGAEAAERAIISLQSLPYILLWAIRLQVALNSEWLLSTHSHIYN